MGKVCENDFRHLREFNLVKAIIYGQCWGPKLARTKLNWQAKVNFDELIIKICSGDSNK